MHIAFPRGEPWRRTAIAIALGVRITTLLLVQAVLKDWLVSAYSPRYPLIASLATTAGVAIAVIAPFVIRRASRWHEVLLVGAGVAVFAHLAGLVPARFGVVPSVPVLACAMALSRLLIAERVSERQQAVLAIGLGLGLVALVHPPDSNMTATAWGMASAVAVTAPVIAIVRLTAPSTSPLATSRRTAAILALAAAPALFFAISMRPLLSIPLTRLALAGVGLGWQNPGTLWHVDLFALAAARPSPALLVVVLAVGVGLACVHTDRMTLRRRLAGVGILVVTLTVSAPAPIAMTTGPDGGGAPGGYPDAARLALPFVVTLAREQGLFVVALLLLLLLLAAVTVPVVVARCAAGAAHSEQAALAAGSIGALAGMVIGARLAPPFLTADSTLGTAAFAAVLASLPLSLETRACGPGIGPRRSAAHRRRWPRLLAAAFVLGLGIVAVVLVVWEWSARRQVLPLVGTGPPPGYDTYVPLAGVSPSMQAATIAYENPLFYEDHGFEWRSIFDMLRLNVRQARIVAGGSGITQQLAKNLFLTPHRTLSRKLRETMLTIALDALLTKERILEIYLNTIDYGMGQRGIAAAARFYFGTTPDKLDVAQSAMLVGLVPHPPKPRLSLHDLSVGQHLAFQALRGLWPTVYGDEVLAKLRAVPLESLLRVPASVLATEEQAVSPQTSPQVADVRGVRFILIVATIAALALLGSLFRRAVMRTIAEPHAISTAREAALLGVVALTTSALAMGWWWERSAAERAGATILAPYVASPNWNQRAAATGVSAIVLHATVDEDDMGVVRYFGDFTSTVSAHFVVNKEGRVAQLVPIEGRAWHAGKSELGAVTDVNDISVGIEMVNRNDGIDPYPRLQYEAVARLIRQLRQRYQISLDRIVSHAEIARPVGRKSDPRGFDFERLRRLIVRGVP